MVAESRIGGRVEPEWSRWFVVVYTRWGLLERGRRSRLGMVERRRRSRWEKTHHASGLPMGCKIAVEARRRLETAFGSAVLEAVVAGSLLMAAG